LTDVVTWLFAEDPIDTPAVDRRARMLFLDTLGCMIAGLSKPEPKALAEVLARLEPGPVLLPGAEAPLSITSAAYIAGIAACWDEACEGLPRAHGRPGLHAFAAALALGLGAGKSLGRTLSALVAGFEVGGRLGEVMRIPSGMHVDGTWGTFAAVTAAAHSAGFDVPTTVAAIEGAACHMPWSLYLPIAEGATVRNAYVGEAAARGIRQAFAAQAGITAPATALETVAGLALGRDITDQALAPPGEWLIEQGYLKPFAAVRHVHYGATAAIEWRRRHGDIVPSDIQALTMAIYGEAITYCGNRAPATAIQAQFSLSYGLAWALVHGDLGPDAYEAQSLQDPAVRRLEAMVTIEEDAAFTCANKRAANLTVETATAKETIAVDGVAGDPDRPMTQDDIIAKFLRFAAPAIGTGRAESLAEAVLEKDRAAPLSSLM
jgi:2-methylcitrate dehydratase PrpD